MPLLQRTVIAAPNPVGQITQILNAKMAGSQGMTWSYENNGGVIRGNRSYTNTLRVFTSSPFVGPIQIQQALVGIGAVQGSYYTFPLPEYNQPTPGAGDYTFPSQITEFDTGSFLHTMDIRQETEDAKQWLCTFSYGPFDLNHEVGDPAAGLVNPLQAAPKVKWTPVVKEVGYPSDINGVPFVSNTGEPLENAPKREQSDQTLTFTRNEATYNESWAQTYRHSLNLNDFLGFAPKQVKCKSITGERVYDSDFGYFWVVEYEFEMRRIEIKQPVTFDPITGLPDDSSGATSVYGWEELILNQGFRERGTDGKTHQILIDGMPVTSPVPIDADGRAYPLENDPGNPNPPPYFLIFDFYPSLDFAFLNIPDNLLDANT
jgi:hypothetical protein